VSKDEEMRSKLKFVMLVSVACSLSVLSSCTTTRENTQVTEAEDPQNQQLLRTGMYEDRSRAKPSRVLVGRGPHRGNGANQRKPQPVRSNLRHVKVSFATVGAQKRAEWFTWVGS
jgi:hypothetical protein